MQSKNHIIRLEVLVIFLFWITLNIESMAGEQQLAKIVVKDSGIYRVTSKDLIQAGVELKKVDPRKINLLNRGKPVPIRIAGEEDGKFDARDYLDFWGTFNAGITTYKDIYSEENAYFLVYGGGEPCRFQPLRFSADKAVIPASEAEALLYRTVHFEELLEKKWRHFENYGGEPTDFAFWYWIDSRVRDFRRRFSLPDLLPNRGRVGIRVKVYGRSNLPVNPDHHVVVELNGQKVGDFTFDGTTGYLWEENNLPPYLLKQQDNVIQISLPGDLEEAKKVSPPPGPNQPDRAFDWVYLDWFELEYPVRYVATDDVFTGYTRQDDATSRTLMLEISGFSSPEIVLYDKGNSINPVAESRKDATGRWTVRFPALINGKTDIFITTAEKIGRHLRIEKINETDLLTECHQKELVIVTYDDFYSELLPLQDWKRKRGVSTAVVKTSDVYNQFNYGLKHPVAIKNMLQRLWQQPSRKLKYVLLVGTACEDHKNLFGGARQDLVPTNYYSSPLFVAYANDNWFVALDNSEGIPNLAIGRLPAESKEQVRNAVNKIIEYEKKMGKNSGVRPRALFIASYESSIKYQADMVADVLTSVSRHIEIVKTYASQDDLYKDDNARKIISHFNEGLSLVFFVGHGGNNVWEAGPTRLKAKNLFDLGHVETLSNRGKYPIVITATCYTAAFDTPADVESIGMKLVNKKDGGAIAVIGTPHRSMLMYDLQFMRTIVKYLADRSCKTLGDAFVRAKQEIKFREILEPVTLLGDPSLDITFLQQPTNE